MSLRTSLLRMGRRALIIPPILAGGWVLAVVVANRNAPQQESIPEVARPLLVIEVPETNVVPRVLGYGTARPGDVWSAVAEVKGRIVEAHPELKAGAVIRQGTTVVRIDPTEYELQVARLRAEVAQIVAQQAELDVEQANHRKALAIEEEGLDLAERELRRVTQLRSDRAISESEYDQTLRSVLTQRQSVQSLRSSLDVLPSRREALVATLAARQAGLEQAELDVQRTVLTAPFDCRLSEVSLEVDQFVAAGQVLFEAYGAAVTEVEAQVPIDQVRTLLKPAEAPLDLTDDAMKVIRTVFNVEAVVRMRTGDFTVEWEGRFDRVREELDLQTRTLRLVVAVDRPYEGVIPGQRPPLAPGMFCEVELRGEARPQQIVIPRTSLKDGAVYLVNGDNRLARREVTVAFSQGGFSVIKEGLRPGERIVVSDPTPAIEGMLVEPKIDIAIAQRLIAEAGGEGRVR